MKFADNYQPLVIGCLFILTVLVIPITFSDTGGSNSSQSVYPINSKPYGLTYGEWTVKWWQWASSIPAKDNPVADENGEKCAVGQNDPNVWFIAGTGGGEATRACTIPAGKAILVSIINVVCSYATDPGLKSESELRSCAKADQDKATNLQASVDGVAIPNLKMYRVQSPLFNMTLPNDNVLASPPGTTQAVSDGYWILLKPLQLGNHEIHFSGSLVDFTATGALNFVSDAKYDIRINS
jgi:hypothetical protein